MPTTPPERVEFMSDAWLDAARDALATAAADKNLDDAVSFTLSETFTGAPPHLADSAGSVAWHARITGRQVEVGRGPASDADLKIRADHQAALPSALTQHGAGQDATARAERETRHRHGAETSVVEGTLPEDPRVVRVLAQAHDDLARRTTDEAPLDHRIDRLGLADAAHQLTDQGYCVLESAVTEDFADELRATILELIAENDRPVPAGLLLGRGRIFEEAALHPWLLALAELVCGKGNLLAQLLGTRRGEGPGLIGIHSDYNNVRAPFPDYGLNCTACWALEDWTVAAGPTVIAPRSHRRRAHPDDTVTLADFVPIEMPKGSIALWDGATWHAQGERTLPGHRVVLHQTFSRLTLRTYDDYSSIDPAILDRNPPILTTMCGFDDIFEKNTHRGPEFERLAWSRDALTT